MAASTPGATLGRKRFATARRYLAVGRVRRGGGWANDARHCQSAYRGRFAPAYRIVDLVCLLTEAMILHSEAVKKLGQAPSRPLIFQRFRRFRSEPVPFFHSLSMNARLRKVRSLFLPGDQAVDTFQDRADEGS